MASRPQYLELPSKDSAEDDIENEDDVLAIAQPGHGWKPHGILYFVFFISGVISWIGALLVVKPMLKKESPIRVYSPADVVIEDQIWDFTDHADMRYTGPLNAAQDTAWRTLCGESEGFVQIEMTDSMVKKLPPSTQIPKYPNHQLYGLAVCHSLHCLNIIRLAADPEYYAKTVPTKNHLKEAETVHVEFLWLFGSHCLDYIRQSVMCKADTALEYFKWDDEMGRTFSQMDIPHQCVNFDKLIEWSDKHQLRDRGPWMGLHYLNESTFD